MFGLSKDGFKRKRLIDIQNELKTKWKESFGEDSNVESGINNKIISLIAWALSGLWQLAEKVYNSGFIHKAEGRSLDYQVGNRLMKRRAAEKAKGYIVIEGIEMTTIEQGLMVSNGESNYITLEEVVIGENGIVEVEIESIEAGSQTNSPSNTITEIVTPLVGIDSVNNPDLISGGRDEETDAELRTRYELSHSTGNSPSTNGIRAEVLGVEGVRTATVIDNLSLETDEEGRPGRSFETYVLGGGSKDIAQAIFRRRAAGIQAYGQVIENVVDDSGNIVPIGYTPANEVNLYLNIEVITNEAFPSDGNRRIRTAIIQYIGGLDYDGNEYTGLGMGQNVIYTRLISIIHRIEGVKEVPTLEVGKAGRLGTNNITILPTQVAITDYNKVVII